MSPEITEQLEILFHFFVLGISISLVYDGLRLLRFFIPHHNIIIAIQDLIFWVATGFVVFDMFLRESNGSIRFFSIGGALLGMILKNRLTSIINPGKMGLCKHWKRNGRNDRTKGVRDNETGSIPKEKTE